MDPRCLGLPNRSLVTMPIVLLWLLSHSAELQCGVTVLLRLKRIIYFPRSYLQSVSTKDIVFGETHDYHVYFTSKPIGTSVYWHCFTLPRPQCQNGRCVYFWNETLGSLHTGSNVLCADISCVWEYATDISCFLLQSSNGKQHCDVRQN
jgi:hypothetical protein